MTALSVARGPWALKPMSKWQLNTIYTVSISVSGEVFKGVAQTSLDSIKASNLVMTNTNVMAAINRVIILSYSNLHQF
jgi:hypothetical protein